MQTTNNTAPTHTTAYPEGATLRGTFEPLVPAFDAPTAPRVCGVTGCKNAVTSPDDQFCPACLKAYNDHMNGLEAAAGW